MWHTTERHLYRDHFCGNLHLVLVIISCAVPDIINLGKTLFACLAAVLCMCQLLPAEKRPMWHFLAVRAARNTTPCQARSPPMCVWLATSAALAAQVLWPVKAGLQPPQLQFRGVHVHILWVATDVDHHSVQNVDLCIPTIFATKCRFLATILAIKCRHRGSANAQVITDRRSAELTEES